MRKSAPEFLIFQGRTKQLKKLTPPIQIQARAICVVGVTRIIDFSEHTAIGNVLCDRKVCIIIAWRPMHLNEYLSEAHCREWKVFYVVTGASCVVRWLWSRTANILDRFHYDPSLGKTFTTHQSLIYEMCKWSCYFEEEDWPVLYAKNLCCVHIY